MLTLVMSVVLQVWSCDYDDNDGDDDDNDSDDDDDNDDDDIDYYNDDDHACEFRWKTSPSQLPSLSLLLL